MNSEKILILGSSGFLGGYFQKNLGSLAIGHTSGSDKQSQVIPHEYVSARLDSEEDVDKLLTSLKFSTVINCVALSDIDECETSPQKATWLNTKLPEVVSRKCNSIGAHFIQISTDAVFSGDRPFPIETNKPNPKSIYGITKAEGESAILRVNPNSLVCRVSFFGWNPRGKSLFNFFYSNLRTNQQISGFDDLFFTPMYAADTVDIILALCKKRKSGIFHVVGDERISKFEFGQLVAKSMNAQSTLIDRESFLDSRLSLTRTPDLSLSNVKIKSLGIKIPTLNSGIESLVKEVKSYDV